MAEPVRHILAVYGTRPEVIKMAPVIRELRARPRQFRCTVVSTGQHRDMCRPYEELFGIRPDIDLSIMVAGQTLDHIVGRIVETFPPVLEAQRPDAVLVQGDTSSAFAAALVAFHAKIAVGHVEAGLRTGNRHNPFPEEMNRCLISTLADLHFAPTAASSENLRREGIDPARVFVTGNTVIDALKYLLASTPAPHDAVLESIDPARRIVAVTTHRRESFGQPLLNTLRALKAIAERFPDVEIVLPVHYNPNVREHVHRELGRMGRVHLVDPMPYERFIRLVNRATLVLTDSGGVQEEAPALGKPVLVLRETTERPEGVTAGVAKLVGTDPAAIIDSVSELLSNPAAYAAMVRGGSPYGDGKAAARIAEGLSALPHDAHAGG